MRFFNKYVLRGFVWYWIIALVVMIILRGVMSIPVWVDSLMMIGFMFVILSAAENFSRMNND